MHGVMQSYTQERREINKEKTVIKIKKKKKKIERNEYHHK